MKIIAHVSAVRYHGDDSGPAFPDYEVEVVGFSIRSDGRISSLSLPENKWLEIKPGMDVRIKFVQ